ncbi:MAG: rod shape-determining protein MreC [Firmicutes bacterium]|nr:rod shape-determining protein MreC [Bacillota bacterium]HPU01439.1 rod shape-determining protein MreC [Bacillota bacterium]
MARRNQGRRSLVALLVVVFGLLLLIVFTGEGREQLTPVEDALLALFAPAQTAFASAGQKIQSFFDAIVSFYELKAENDILRKRIAFLEQQLVRFQELQKENYRYRQLLEFKEKSSYRTMAAEVIARDPSQWFGTVTINRGYMDGVKQEMVVVTERGLVGIISTVSPHSSQVLLITDPRLAVSALIQRTRDPGTVGIVESFSEDPAYLKISYLPPEAKIQPGDVVITSGLGGVFPKGLVIGTIKEVLPDPSGMILSALIEPRVNFNRLEEVLIIVEEGAAGESSPQQEESAPEEAEPGA